MRFLILGIWCLLLQNSLPAQECLPDPGPAAQGVGSAFEVHRDLLPEAVVQRLSPIRAAASPDAAELLRLAPFVRAVPAHELAPTYLRDRVTN